jgi:hypothetical protein
VIFSKAGTQRYGAELLLRYGRHGRAVRSCYRIRARRARPSCSGREIPGFFILRNSVVLWMPSSFAAARRLKALRSRAARMARAWDTDRVGSLGSRFVSEGIEADVGQISLRLSHLCPISWEAYGNLPKFTDSVILA